MANPANGLIATLNNLTFWINRISPIITIILGTFGNFFNIIVFIRRPLRTNPCSLYFLAGSIANCFVMYVALLTRYLATSWNIDPSATNLLWCKVRYFLVYPSLSLALWFIVLASIDRFLSSSVHIRLRQLSTVSVARKYIAITTVFMFLINIHVFVFAIRSEAKDGRFTCTIFPGKYFLFFNFFVPIVSCILPLVLMGLFGTLTIRNVRLIRNRVVPQGGHVRNERLRSSDRQLIIMLLCQVTISTIVVSPWAFINMYNAIAITILEHELSALGEAAYNLAYNVSRMLYYTNPMLGFYIYTLSGVRFRMEIKYCLIHAVKSTLKATGLARCLPSAVQRALFNEIHMANNNHGIVLRRRGNTLHSHRQVSNQINAVSPV